MPFKCQTSERIPKIYINFRIIEQLQKLATVCESNEDLIILTKFFQCLKCGRMPNLHELIGHLTMYYNVHTCALLHCTCNLAFFFYLLSGL